MLRAGSGIASDPIRYGQWNQPGSAASPARSGQRAAHIQGRNCGRYSPTDRGVAPITNNVPLGLERTTDRDVHDGEMIRRPPSCASSSSCAAILPALGSEQEQLAVRAFPRFVR